MDIVAYENKEQWLAARRIGASDVAAVLGVSPWATQWDVWCRLTGEVGYVQPTGDHLDRGRRWEWAIITEYGHQTDHRWCLKKWADWTLIHGEEEWQTVTPDAECRDPLLKGNPVVGMVECKTTTNWDWPEPMAIEKWPTSGPAPIFAPYYLQCQYQAAVGKVDWVDLAVLLPKYELRIYHIKKDPDVVGPMMDTLGAWYEKHVKGGIPPIVNGSRACNRWMARDATPGPLEPPVYEDRVSDEQRELALEYRRLNEAYWDLDKKRKLVVNKLCAVIDSETRGIHLGEGRKVLVVRSAGRTSIDHRALLQKHPELEDKIAPFIKPGNPYASVRTYGWSKR